MGNRKKPAAWVLLGLYVAWTLVIQPIWNLNVERLAERNMVDGALAGLPLMAYLREIAGYLPSSFAAGFVIGSLVFAYWDAIVRWYERRFTIEGERHRMRAWVGSITPHFDCKERKLALWMQVIGVGEVAYRFAGVDGSVTLTGSGRDGGKRAVVLGVPHFTQISHGYMTAGTYVLIAIEMTLPSEVTDDLPDLFTWSNPRTYLQFADLNVWLESRRGTRKRLKLWESRRLTAGDWEVRGVETFSINKNGVEDKMLEALEKVRDHFLPKP